MHTPKLSELSEQDKIRLAAELDGQPVSPHYPVAGYSTSYDAVIPLIQKQDRSTRYALRDRVYNMLGNEKDTMFATPAQLLDSLLVATGKATI